MLSGEAVVSGGADTVVVDVVSLRGLEVEPKVSNPPVPRSAAAKTLVAEPGVEAAGRMSYCEWLPNRVRKKARLRL
jgi:hypothetical protein